MAAWYTLGVRSRFKYCVAVAATALLFSGAGPRRAFGADANSLVGIHFWGDRNDSTPTTLLNSTVTGGYDLEIVNTDNLARGGWKDEDVVDPLYQNFSTTYKVTPITRIGHYWGETLPAPGTQHYTDWPSYIATNIAGRMKNTAHLWQLGNEPNLHGEATNWVNQQINPADYATLYRNVRAAIKAPAVTGAAGTHQLLVAPVSPGGVAGDRWMDGNTWLDQTLAAIPSNEVDGVALHAYGGQATARGSFQDFRKSLIDQLTTIDNRGLTSVPVYLTEWNRNTQIGSAADEAVTAEFARQSLKFLDRWNRTPGNHNVVASNWFVYDSPANNGTGWDSYSIEYWKTHGGSGAGDLYQAFYDSARAGYKAGSAGTKPIPSGVGIFDDFESSDGRFAGASASMGVTGTTGVTGGFKVRQNDTDSYTKSYAQKIGINDNNADPAGWTVRYVSGAGSPSNNQAINLTSGNDGNIGFFLRVYTVNGSENTSSASGLTTQITMDSGPTGGNVNTDISIARAINPDGDWHWYEWSLDDPAQWLAWSVATGSDGKLGTNADFLGQVSLDSLIFNGPNGMNVEYILDTVSRNVTGSLSVMASVPEPGSMLLVFFGLLPALRRRR